MGQSNCFYCTNRLVGHIDVVRLGCQSVHHGVDGLAFATQVFFSVRQQIGILADFVQPGRNECVSTNTLACTAPRFEQLKIEKQFSKKNKLTKAS